MTRGIKRDVMVGKKMESFANRIFFKKIDPIPFISLSHSGVPDLVSLGCFVSSRCECLLCMFLWGNQLIKAYVNWHRFQQIEHTSGKGQVLNSFRIHCPLR